MMPLLAYRPFLEPLPLDASWLVLLVPMVIAISVVYKTIKVRDLRKVPQQAALLAAQIVLFMVAAAAILWIVTELA